MAEIIVEALKTLGLPVALLLVFLWWAYKKDQRQEQRYDELAEKLNRVEDYQRKELQSLTIKTTESINSSTSSIDSLVEQLKKRPCLKE